MIYRGIDLAEATDIEVPKGERDTPRYFRVLAAS